VDVPRWGERERLLNEKQALGFFLSGHPYNEYAQELKSFVKRRLGELQAQRDPVLMAGVVISTRTQMTRRGKMCIVLLDDASKQLEVSVFNELWEAERSKIKEDELLLVEGKVQNDDYTGGLRITADRLLTLGEARARFAKALRLSMNGGTRSGDAQRLQAILAPFRRAGGACPVRIAYCNREAQTDIVLPENWRVTLDDALLASLNEWLTPANVKVVYS
jgi:DNA polymerase-3 subunit alpha